MNNKKNKKGFALTEVLLAIAVIVIVGIAAYPLFSSARTQAKAEIIANDTLILQKAMVTLFAPTHAYNNTDDMNNSDELITTTGLAPDDLANALTAHSYWTLPSGGYIQTEAVQNASGGFIKPGAGFTIAITQISKDICTDLATRLAPAFEDVGTTSGSGNIKGPSNPTVNITQIENVCSSSTAANRALYFGSR